MKIIITAVIEDDNGIERVFQGTYDELHNRDWNERVQNILDSAHEYEKDK